MTKSVNRSIELTVDYHESDRYTLKRRQPGEALYSDLKGELFGNTDKGEFYRAVARMLGNLAESGSSVAYRDIA